MPENGRVAPKTVSIVTTLLVALAAMVLVGISPGRAVAAPPLRCNGSAQLCDRSLGEVAFATSHNSMSSPVDGFRAPNQGTTIADQLKQGIRGFQIDAYPGVTRGNRVYTDLAGPFGEQATDLRPSLVRAAVRIHERLGAPPAGTPTEVYLCHTFCELGGIKMSTVARDIRKFLDANPNEVLVFVIEEYVPPQRLQEVFDNAGLGQMMYAVTPGAPLPTLGAMIRAGTRILVSLENADGGPKLPNAFTGLVEETPFFYATPADLRDERGCPPNRGVAGSPIFQFNHWVTPANRVGARAVNYRVLRDRVERCVNVRKRVPTLVAVDFAYRSDVIDVVRNLNRRGTAR